ncbi:MAG: protein translocase subunit SecD [Alphaproteobacteria bacterium]|nr:protein translocase subunit SecD [Alphaproteobacteria bacterium]
MLQFPIWKIFLVIAVCVVGLAYAVPNLTGNDFAKNWPRWLPGKTVNLGLDLRGGSHLLLQVESDVVVSERLEAIQDDARRALRRAKIGYTNLTLTEDAVTLKLRREADRDQAREVLTAVDADTEVIFNDAAVRIGLRPETVTALKDRALMQSIEIVRRRIDETGTNEPNIQRQGANRIVVQLPGIDNPDRVKALLGKTAKLTFQLVDLNNSVNDALAGRVPPGSRLLPADADGAGPSHYLVRRRIMVSGDRLVDASSGFDQNNRPAVFIRFDQAGARQFGRTTQANVNRPFAIVLDGRVLSAPVINEPILGGTAQITGSFSVAEAQDLALLLRAGALPAPLRVIEERTVGPGLGLDSIAAGKLASIVGMVLVVAFMIVCYGRFGLMADIALFFNVVLILAALSLLQATLTLPGIAGIVLTMGMAVDANVLIFERIREEIRHGRSPFNAVETGYRRAITTIIDSNLTTLFAAVFLFSFGSGPVRGFAVTLAIGILTSMFTAVMVTRMMVVLWLRRRRPSSLTV